jgi:hypothetical protein
VIDGVDIDVEGVDLDVVVLFDVGVDVVGTKADEGTARDGGGGGALPLPFW